MTDANLRFLYAQAVSSQQRTNQQPNTRRGLEDIRPTAWVILLPPSTLEVQYVLTPALVSAYEDTIGG